jgi:DNA-binding CsgD family transcriptional regulator
MGMTGKQGQLLLLTEKQKDCLRLVSHNYSSKEIGRKLGVSPFAVDQRLRIAARNLGVDSRFEAARLLAANELSDRTLSEPFIYQAPHVRSEHEPDSSGLSGALRDQGLGTHHRVLRDAGLATWPPSDPTSIWDFEMISEPRGFREPLGWPVKAAIAIAIALLSLIAFGAAITGLEVLSRLN